MLLLDIFCKARRERSLALIIHHTSLGSFDIVELSGLCGPEKNEPGSETDEEHEEDKCNDGPEHILPQG